MQISDIFRGWLTCFDSYFLLLYSKQGIGEFFSTNIVLVIESFYVHICGELWVFINCVGSNLSFIHIAFYPLLFKKIILLFNFSCLNFLPTPLSHHSQTHLPPLFQPSPCYCPCVLYNCSWKPFTLFLLIPSHLHSGHCQPVLNFSVFGYVWLACSFH